MQILTPLILMDRDLKLIVMHMSAGIMQPFGIEINTYIRLILDNTGKHS